MANQALADKFKNAAEQMGIKIRKVIVLGRYLHVDSFNEHDAKLRDIFGRMGADKVITMAPGADGKHLDGNSGFRIVAKF